jgi:hypothetical protein
VFSRDLTLTVSFQIRRYPLLQLERLYIGLGPLNTSINIDQASPRNITLHVETPKIRPRSNTHRDLTRIRSIIHINHISALIFKVFTYNCPGSLYCHLTTIQAETRSVTRAQCRSQPTRKLWRILLSSISWLLI